MVCPISHLDWLHLLWSICEKSSRRYVYKQHGVHGRHHCTDNQLVDCTDWSSYPSLRWEKSIKSVTFTMPIRNNTKKATNSSFGLFLFAIHFVPCGWPVKCMVPMVHIFAKEDWKWKCWPDVVQWHYWRMQWTDPSLYPRYRPIFDAILLVDDCSIIECYSGFHSVGKYALSNNHGKSGNRRRKMDLCPVQRIDLNGRIHH